ncbi:hypothetical protein BASA81_016523 [Batrachochytrium salamandrivorans]|nr:hypothetical protein BASA81_016523 [Batrachochytrium salamandrivorans]
MNIAGGGALLDEFLDGTRFIPEAHLEHVVKRARVEEARDEESELLAGKVDQIRQRLELRAQEKKVLSQQLVDLCKSNLDRLVTNCQFLETELKRLGELEDEQDQAGMMYVPSSLHSQSLALGYTPPPPITSLSSSSFMAQSPPPSSSQPSTTPASASSPNSGGGAGGGQTTARGLVAANSEDLWILAKFVEDRQDTILVADADNDSSRLELPRNKVVFLNDKEDINFAKQRLPKGRTVFALYPETTSFYPALIAQAPFLQSGKASVYCVFADDEDEVTNVAPKRMVPVQFVFVL